MDLLFCRQTDHGRRWTKQIVNTGSLDLFSTSQTKTGAFPVSVCDASSAICLYYAPYFAYKKEGKFYGVSQGCCNHWDCPRCGLLRAKQEYGRIVEGCLLLSKTRPLYFITVTCLGREISVHEATEKYLEWTNRFLTACRTKAKREGQEWYYVQVTEKQKRGHPHSHFLTTFSPNDLREGEKDNWRRKGGILVNERIPCLRSDWLQSIIISAGLGSQYDVSRVKTAAAASRYVAKYLFKPTIFTAVWPKGWKRVRYSQSFPQLPERETNAFVLLARSDWQKLASLATAIVTDSPQTKEQVLWELRGHDVLVG